MDGEKRFAWRATHWVEELKHASGIERPDVLEPDIERQSSRSGKSRSTLSSTRSKKRSRGNAQQAEAVLQMQHSKLLESRQKARREDAERADKV